MGIRLLAAALAERSVYDIVCSVRAEIAYRWVEDRAMVTVVANLHAKHLLELRFADTK